MFNAETLKSLPQDLDFTNNLESSEVESITVARFAASAAFNAYSQLERLQSDTHYTNCLIRKQINSIVAHVAKVSPEIIHALTQIRVKIDTQQIQ